MKKNVLLIVLVAVLCSCTVSKRVSELIEPELPSPDAAPVDLKAYEKKYGKYDGIYLYVDKTIEHTGTKESLGYGLDSWDYYKIDKFKYVVFNPSASRLTTIELDSKPDKIYVFVHAPDGTTRKFGLKDMEEVKDFRGYKNYVIILPEVVRGSVVELGYEYGFGVSYFLPPMAHDFPLQFYVPCENLKITYAYPDWWKLGFKQIEKGVSPEYSTDWDEGNHKRFVKCVRKDIPAIIEEPYSPYFKEVAEYLQFMVTDFEMRGFSQEAPQTWLELAEKFQERFLKKSKKSAKKIEDYAKKLTNTIENPQEKLELIVSHIRDEFDLGYKSKEGNYSKVIKNKEGNLFDLVGLTRELLNYSGIPAEIILASSAKEGFFDDYYVSFKQLGTLAVRTLIGDTYRVILPQEKHVPITFTPEYVQGEQALIVTGDSAGFFWEVPFDDDQTHSVIEEYEVSISEDGVVTVKETKIMQGYVSHYFRKLLENYKDDEKKDAVEQLLTYSDGQLNLTDYSINNLDNYDQPLIVNYQYTIDNLVTITPEDIIFNTGGLFSPISERKGRLESSEIVNSIVLRTKREHEKRIRITFPENWEIVTELNNVNTQNKFGSITADYEINQNVFTAHQNLQLKRVAAPKEGISEFLTLAGNNSALNLPMILFSPKLK